MELAHVDFYTSNGEEFFADNEKLRVLQDAFVITFYNNTAETNRVDKTNYLTLVSEISGNLREETSLTDLVITIQQSEVPTFNYAYIKSFNRYYYVTDIASVRSNLWEISLSVDVLMTYKEALLNCTGFIDRNEFEYDPLIVDDKLPLKQGQTVKVDFLTNELFSNSADYFSYVLQGLNLTTEDN